MNVQLISCENKKFATGCPSCWSCEVCGRSGCDNLIGYEKGLVDGSITIETVNCKDAPLPVKIEILPSGMEITTTLIPEAIQTAIMERLNK